MRTILIDYTNFISNIEKIGRKIYKDMTIKLIMVMKEKETNVIMDKRQTRVTIPSEFVDFINIKKGEYEIGWSLDYVRKELIGVLIKKQKGELKK